MSTAGDWRRIDAALDEILSLPPADWPGACARIGADDAALRRELESLLVHVGGEDPVLDFPAGSAPREAAPPTGVASGTRVGAYRLLELLGRGGMGEVYRAERADGQFEQQVAVKLMRPDVIERPQRFHAERQILARLEHPHIAGLRDGGVADDGRLYMVMDLVVGTSITQWCREHGSSLNERLQLFVAVCDAVAYAHRKLIVHRDLKPGNVFVTVDGQVKLLDFGIARLVDGASYEETRTAALTPGYAAPEQLCGGQITTATDVYALGTLLFELVTGTNPWGGEQLPLAALVGRVMDQQAPLASKAAARAEGAVPPVPPKLISGDLDAIIAKAMRKEPESRYESVASMRADLLRMLRSEPVSARDGARWYVAGRFLRRHRWGVAAAAALTLAVLAAAGGIAWQGHIAQQQAARALAVKNFLVQVFRASDPRIASDKPRGQITARELLDISVGRIDRDFATQPDLRLELLGMSMEIYGYLGEDARYEALMKERVALARKLYGDRHPIVVEGEIIDAWASIYTQDFADANRHLARADALLHEMRLDVSELRAQWWVAKERALQATPDSAAARRMALDRAIDLYARIDSHSNYYPAALANAATTRFLDADYAQSADLNLRAIKVEERIPERDDMDLAVIYGNYADALSKLGRFEAAEAAFIKAEDLSRHTFGENYGTYWRNLESHASMLYLHGERQRALSLFATMLAAIPANWKATTDDSLARQAYADCITHEGRAAEAVPMLEAVEKVLSVRPRHDYDLRRLRLLMGAAYEDVGRIDAARTALQWAMQDYRQHEQRGAPGTLESGERWARFLLGHPRDAHDEATARAVLQQVLADAGPVAAYTTAPALAHADLADIALLAGNAALALQEIDAAQKSLTAVVAVHDVRVADELLLTKSRALASLRRWTEAREAAATALHAAQGHDAPQSLQLARIVNWTKELDQSSGR